MPEELIGEVTHWFGNINVGVIKVNKGTLKVGDTIHITGHGADFTQTIDSLEVDKQPVEELGVGQEAGLKLTDKAKEGCEVHLVTE